MLQAMAAPLKTKTSIFLVFVPLVAFAHFANLPDGPTAYGVVQSDLGVYFYASASGFTQQLPRVSSKPEPALVSSEGLGAKSAPRIRTLRLGSIFLACVLGGVLLVLLFRRSDRHRNDIGMGADFPSASKSKGFPSPAKTHPALWWVAGLTVACLAGGAVAFIRHFKPPLPPPAVEPSPPVFAPTPSGLGPPSALEATALEAPSLEKMAPLEPPFMEAPSQASEERVSEKSAENVKKPENTRTSAGDKSLVQYNGIGSEKVSIDIGLAYITFTIKAYMPAHVPNNIAERLVADAKEDLRKHIRSGKAGIQNCGKERKAREPTLKSGVGIEMDAKAQWNVATSQRTVEVQLAPYSSFKDAELSECLAKRIQELAVPWTKDGKLNEARLKELLEHPLMSHPLTRQHSIVESMGLNATKGGLAVDITVRGTVEVPPGFSSMFVSKNGMQAYLLGKRKELENCTVEQEARNPSLKGMMKVEMEVEWNLITSQKTSKLSSVSPDSFRGTYFADCVTQLAQTWQHVEVHPE